MDGGDSGKREKEPIQQHSGGRKVRGGSRKRNVEIGVRFGFDLSLRIGRFKKGFKP